MKQNAIHTTHNTTEEIEIASKVKAIFEADWTHIFIGKTTTQFVINWNKSGMKTMNHFMVREVEEITGRQFNDIAIHSTKAISLIFYGEQK